MLEELGVVLERYDSIFNLEEGKMPTPEQLKASKGQQKPAKASKGQQRRSSGPAPNKPISGPAAGRCIGMAFGAQRRRSLLL
jgi:hypothetical protein